MYAGYIHPPRTTWLSGGYPPTPVTVRASGHAVRYRDNIARHHLRQVGKDRPAGTHTVELKRMIEACSEAHRLPHLEAIGHEAPKRASIRETPLTTRPLVSVRHAG
jgi:hypothetical protein